MTWSQKWDFLLVASYWPSKCSILEPFRLWLRCAKPTLSGCHYLKVLKNLLAVFLSSFVTPSSKQQDASLCALENVSDQPHLTWNPAIRGQLTGAFPAPPVFSFQCLFLQYAVWITTLLQTVNPLSTGQFPKSSEEWLRATRHDPSFLSFFFKYKNNWHAFI